MTDKITLPGSLAKYPRLSQWLRIQPDGRVLVHTGKVELGQGILTALRQIAAEELDVAVRRVDVASASTDISPNEGHTSGSRSVQESGLAIRQASACARAIHVSICAQRTGVSPESIAVVDGDFIGPDGPIGSYWAQTDDHILDCDADPTIAPKKVEDRTIVGTASPRLDLPEKVTGQPRFIHDLRLDGMRYAKVIRPPSRGAKLVSIKEEPGIHVIVDGDFVAVLCDSESEANASAARLASRITWDERDTLPGSENVRDWIRAAAPEPTVFASRPAKTEAAHVIQREVYRPYVAHASMAPSCALAHYDGTDLQVWTHSQGIFGLRRDLAMALGIDAERITAHHREGAGCYGHNAADDVAFDASFIAVKAPGAPVRVMWSREDEMSWSPFSSAMLVSIEAGLDTAGKIVSWSQSVRSNGHSNRPGAFATPALLGASHLKDGAPLPIANDPPTDRGGGAERNAEPLYVTGGLEVSMARITDTPLRASSLRSLGAMTNVFAAETMIDELAAATEQDPIQFRIDHLDDQRAIAVLRVVEEMRGDAAAEDGFGFGLGFARYKNSSAYCAVLAQVEVETDVAVRHLWIAADGGEIINPDGTAHQIEGGAVQACSFALKEEVRFDRRQILSTDWEEYPILRFSEVPAVDVKLIAPPGAPPLGVGECSTGPTIAAIANAIHDAVGVRPSTMPFTADNLADEILRAEENLN